MEQVVEVGIVHQGIEARERVFVGISKGDVNNNNDDPVRVTGRDEVTPSRSLLERWNLTPSERKIDEDDLWRKNNDIVNAGSANEGGRERRCRIVREEFRSRLESFSSITYFAKPTSLSPIRCARYGWRNVDVDVLMCDHCGASLAIMFLSNIPFRVYHHLTKSYIQELRTSHRPSCPHYRVPSDAVNDNDRQRQRKDVASRGTTTTTVSTCRPLIPTVFASVFPERQVQILEHPHPIQLVREDWLELLQNLSKICVAQLRMVAGVSNAAGTGTGQRTAIAAAPASETRDSSNQLSQPISIMLELSEYFLLYQDGEDQPSNKRQKQRQVNLHSRMAQILQRYDDGNGQDETQDDHHHRDRAAHSEGSSLEDTAAALILLGWRLAAVSDGKNGHDFGAKSAQEAVREENTAASELPNTSELAGDDRATNATEEKSVTSSPRFAIELECPICLAKWSSSSSPSTVSVSVVPNEQQMSSDKPSPAQTQRDATTSAATPTKKVSRTSEPVTMDPIRCHRYYCPYVCGFPRSCFPHPEEATKKAASDDKQDVGNEVGGCRADDETVNGSDFTKPLWQSLADRLLLSESPSQTSALDTSTTTTETTSLATTAVPAAGAGPSLAPGSTGGGAGGDEFIAAVSSDKNFQTWERIRNMLKMGISSRKRQKVEGRSVKGTSAGK